MHFMSPICARQSVRAFAMAAAGISLFSARPEEFPMGGRLGFSEETSDVAISNSFPPLSFAAPRRLHAEHGILSRRGAGIRPDARRYRHISCEGRRLRN